MEESNKNSVNFLLAEKANKYIGQKQISNIKAENLIDLENKEDLICPICFFILNNPKSCSDKKNSHTFCEKCIDKYLEENNNCPTCKLDFENKINKKLYNTLNKQNFNANFKEKVAIK